MAKTLSLQKSLTGLMTLVFTFVVVAPGGLLLNAPRASANAPIVVNNLNDSGAGSLRQAMLDANGAAGADTLDIQVAGTIALLSSLPALTESLDMLATTTVQADSNIVLNLGGAGAGSVGLTLTTGAFNIQGIAIQTAAGNVTYGIVINAGVTSAALGASGAESALEIYNCSIAGISIATGASNVTIQNDYIGKVGGANAIGISATGVTTLTIGGSGAAEGNIISGNTGNGIQIVSSSTVNLKGNRIGVDKDGILLANGGDGVFIDTGNTAVTIGDNTSMGRNYISGNTGNGIKVYSNSTVIKGNYIGINQAGTAAIANGGVGIRLESNNNTIGGTTSADGNVISGNTGDGILEDSTFRNADSTTIKNNYIGINAAGTAAVANGGKGINISGPSILTTTINKNVISGNSTGGITVDGAGSTGTIITGNVIGLNAAGTAAVANVGSGITIGSASNFIGQVGDANRNVISGNTVHGIDLRANTNSVVNNYIGTDITGLIALVNSNNGIQLQNSAASNTMGGTVAGTANTIMANAGMTGVNVNSDAGNFNLIRENNLPGITRGGTANESIAAPVINSAVRTSPTVITVQGTTGTASGTMDFFLDNTWLSTSTADAAGAFNVNLTSSTGTNVFASVTNGTNSTSGTSGSVAVTTDVTASAIPTINYSAQGNAGETSNIYGLGATAGDTVYSNGATTGVTVAADGTFTYAATLVQGTNTFSITIVDGMSNTSGAVVATITGIVAGGSGTSVSAGATGGGSSSSSSTTTTPTTPTTTVEPTTPTTPTEAPIDTTNTDQTPTSMAGDTEVVTPVTTPSTTTTSTTTTTTTTTPSTKPTTTYTKPKSFYSGIYQYVEPIKPVSIRDTMPETPARKPAFGPTLFQSNPFKGETINGIPVKFIELKLGISKPTEADLTADNDNDGLLNGEEILAGSNPNSKDGDGDGISDFQETQFDGTNPSASDSDHDLIPDNKDSEPLIYNDFTENGTAKMFTDYLQSQSEAGNFITEPLGVNDFDQDGLNDEMELDIGTNPLVADTDGDGLTDGDEILFYQADPNNPTAEGTGGVLRLNTVEKETVTQGEQLFMGSADAGSTVGIYKVSGTGTWSLLGQSEADESGRFTVYTTPLDSGRYTLLATQGLENNIEDITSTFTLNVLEWVKRPVYVSLANGASITERQPVIDVQTEKHTMVIFIFRSTIYGSVILADFDGQIVKASPREDLELGDHTVTWYAQDLGTSKKSNPTQVAFNITNEAFVSGQTGSSETSPLTLILGSIAVLASLSALGLYFRRKSSPSRQ
jgi:hypothetical protein